MVEPAPIGEHCFVLSDLHLAEGNLDRGRCLGTENFFSDQEFASLLDQLHSDYFTTESGPLCLILNGDVIDFIRITVVPVTQHELDIWEGRIKILKPSFKLPVDCVSAKEKNYGLKTNDYKCIWKLMKCFEGHPVFFQALSLWLRHGHQLIINIGNHDPEWYWPLVQDYFRLHMKLLSNIGPEQAQSFDGRISFSKKAFPVYDKIWIDHGHNYENMTSIDPDYEYDLVAPKHKLFKGKHIQAEKAEHEKELFIPFGSFFNRYFINKLELDFPYIDNLTIKGSAFKALTDENFGKVAKIIYHFGWYALRIVQKNFQKSFARFFHWILFVILPIALFILLFLKPPLDYFDLTKDLKPPLKTILDGLINIAVPLLIRFLTKKILRFLKLTDPPLADSAFADLGPTGRLKNFNYIILGHNHHPQHIIKSGKEYINTGTWTSKYVQKYERIETGVCFNLAHLRKNDRQQGAPRLLEWIPSTKELIPYRSFIMD